MVWLAKIIGGVFLYLVLAFVVCVILGKMLKLQYDEREQF